MVSVDARNSLESMRRKIKCFWLLARGAEADVRLGEFGGLRAVFKYRRGKPYMHPRLDYILRSRRTRREARAMMRVAEAGVRVPRLYAVFPSLGLIVMEYVEGPKLKEVFDTDPRRGVALSRHAGRMLALIHSVGVVHGDYTTSNIIVGDGGIYIIDFGLSDFTSELEERATDVHLFRRSLESAHAPHAAKAFREFTEGYVEVSDSWGAEVLKRAEEIRLRGRYVEARRRSVWSRVQV